MMANDALERLFNSNNQEQSNYSLDEQMESANDDDFLEGMSDSSKSALFKATEVTLDEIDTSQDEEDDGIILSKVEEVEKNENKDLFNNIGNTEKTPRKKRKPKTNIEQKESSNISSNCNPIMDQLAKDIIDDLRKRNYKISRFDDSMMELIFAYMYNKF